MGSEESHDRARQVGNEVAVWGKRRHYNGMRTGQLWGGGMGSEESHDRARQVDNEVAVGGRDDTTMV